jgi:DNA-binding IclR family transcriptional regulator
MLSAVGRRLPAHATALGRALLADRPERDAVVLLPRSLRPITQRTTTDRSVLLASIATARNAGYAIENEETCLGVSCFAVALPLSHPAMDAISVAVPLARLDDDVRDRVVSHLLKTRGRIGAVIDERSCAVC